MRKNERVSVRRHGDLSAIGARLALCLLVFAAVLFGLQGCSKPKPMDVLWSADLVDPNGLAKNPVWNQMQLTSEPPDPCSLCPCQSQDPQAWKSSSTCTSQTLETNSSLECFGHWNWFPVEYEGVVTWGGHSNSWYDDDDYYMVVKRNDRSLETASRDGLHVEFDSDETVDYWDDTHTWWDDFHHNYVDNGDQAAQVRIGGKFAVVIGLLGLDSQHDVHSELNPVFAMAVHTQDEPARDQWAFFLKNWGNEGFCGDNEEYLSPIRQNVLQILIPHTGATGLELSDNVFVYGDDENERNLQSWSYQSVPGGLLLTFRLRDPSKQVGFMGDLTINWKGGGVFSPPSGPIIASDKTRTSPASAEDEDGNLELKSRLEQLDPGAQQLLRSQTASLHKHSHSTRIKPTPAPSLAELPKPKTPLPNYGTMVRSVKDPALLARKARARELVLSFLKSHENLPQQPPK
jgi:hypothetical protein